MIKKINWFHWLANLGVSVLSLFLFLGTAELISRIWYSPQTAYYPGIFEYDADKVYRLKKSITGFTFAGAPVTTNSFGYRDDEIPIKKETDVIRALVLGDSVSFGHGVLMEETFPELLEEKLNLNHTDYRFDVINTGVPGNSPFQEIIDLERALVFDPDVVIVQFVLNDVVEPYKFLKRHGGTGIDYHGVQDVYWLDHWLRQNSAFYLFLDEIHRFLDETIPKGSASMIDQKELQATEMAKAQSLDWNLAAYEPKNDLERQLWAECLMHLQNEVNLTRSNNIPFLLFVSPVNFQLFNSNATYAQQRLKEFSESNNISYFDLLPILNSEVDRRVAQRHSEVTQKWTEEKTKRMRRKIAKQVWESFFLDYDHYNANGHMLVANQLYPIVSDLLAKKILTTTSTKK